MTRGHLLSFGRVWRNEKWREIQASISLFKFLIMEVSLSLNGWSILVFFFFLMVFCVIVYLCWGGRNDVINKKIKVWFWSYQCSLLSFGQIRWKSNGYYADLRGRANGGGGVVKKQRFSIGSCKEIRPISYYDLEFFLTKMESLATHAPPSLSYVFEASP